MSVVTISRLTGSGGKEIGRKISEKMSYHFVTKNTIEEIFRDYGLIKFDKIYETVPGFWPRFDGNE